MLYQCESCGASIDGVICQYCGHRNAIDLKGDFKISQNDSDRICPNCDIYLDTVIVDKEARLYIEMCRHCKGLFLDFGEIEAIMEREIVVSEKRSIKLLSQIINHPISREKEVRYKKCPNCQKMMNRVNYKQKSGVIMDRCNDCGYWLDAGELRQMMEWAKLEGIRDFTPTLPQASKLKKFNQTTTNPNISTPHYNINRRDPRFGGSHSIHDHSFVVDSFIRKLYGF